jgi:hypothetical protein
MTADASQNISPAKPPRVQGAGALRAVRRQAGAFLERLWHLSASLRACRAEAAVFRGKERQSGEAVRVFYAGNRENLGFILQRLFSEYAQEGRAKKVPAVAVRRLAKEHAAEADLLFLDLELLYCRIMSGAGFIRIPQWVRQRYRVPDSWQAVLGSFRKNTRATDLRKVRKYGFTYALTRAESDFQSFYHRMHKPYLESRYEDLVIIEPEWKFMRQCRKGELMQIVRGGQVLGGVLLHRSDKRLAYVWVGVREGLEAELMKGVFSAMYYFTLLHGYEGGFDEVDFLGTRPLVNDGLFRYKRKWGTYVADSPVPRGDILLKPLRLIPPLQRFFAANSFIARDREGLCGKVLLDRGAGTIADLEEVEKNLATPGLKAIKIYCPFGFAEDAQAWAKSSESGLELVDLAACPDPAAAFCTA